MKRKSVPIVFEPANTPLEKAFNEKDKFFNIAIKKNLFAIGTDKIVEQKNVEHLKNGLANFKDQRPKILIDFLVEYPKLSNEEGKIIASWSKEIQNLFIDIIKKTKEAKI